MSESGLLVASVSLLQKMLRRRPILWVGAGASMAAGHPSTTTLVAAMIAEADQPIDPTLSFEQVADAFVVSQGRSALADLLQAQLGGSRPLTAVHRAIARCAAEGAFAAIVTTNYDDLLERALGEAEVRFVFQKLDENEMVVDADAAVRLVKLHGSRGDWVEVILSGQSYATFSSRYPFLEQQLHVLLRRHPVLFLGCSLQDPRLTAWLSSLAATTRQGLKPWRALMTRPAWDNAIASHEVLAETPTLYPLILEGHAQLEELWAEAAPRSAVAMELALSLEVSASGLRAHGLGAKSGAEDPRDLTNPLADDELMSAIADLHRHTLKPLATDERGVMSQKAADLAAQLRQEALAVGQLLTSKLFSEAALEQLRKLVDRGRTGSTPLLRIRVQAPADLVLQADRLLALPWELLFLDGVFPVEEHTLDLVREAVVGELSGLDPPQDPLQLLALVAAPSNGAALDHEAEMYRLWLALGSEDEKRLVVADLGTLESLLETAARHPSPVLHFSGHGQPGSLIFEDGQSLAKEVSVRDLVIRLRDSGPLPRLIYLSSCYGAGAVEKASDPPGPGAKMVERAALEDDSPSTAASLHRAGFHQVVAYFGPVGDVQATRTAAAFYRGLAQGLTARAALRRARVTATEALRDGAGRALGVYPLGWAQAVLYHRGEDLPTAIASAAIDGARLDAPLERRFDRLDLAGGSVRAKGIEGVQQLKFGFIGRRKPRGEALQRWQEHRCLVVTGLGGLGKTALCAELLRMAGRERPVIALDGRYAAAQPETMASLWQEVQLALPSIEAGLSVEDRARGGLATVFAELQQGGLSGRALALAISEIATQRGLVLYLDDAESLMEAASAGNELGRWRDAELLAFWTGLGSAHK